VKLGINGAVGPLIAFNEGAALGSPLSLRRSNLEPLLGVARSRNREMRKPRLALHFTARTLARLKRMTEFAMRPENCPPGGEGAVS
jgi:hypothetical protein